jgi:hypothetical protein
LINDLNTSASARVSVLLAFITTVLLFLCYWEPLALAGAIATAAILLVLNSPLYRFFFKKKGFQFAAQSIIWHWLYFLYSGAAFGIGALRHRISQMRFQKTSSADARKLAQTNESPMERKG